MGTRDSPEGWSVPTGEHDATAEMPPGPDSAGSNPAGFFLRYSVYGRDTEGK